MQLRPHGYVNIDGIDGSKEMMDIAGQKGLYKNYYISLLGGQHKAPIEDGIAILPNLLDLF